jgi:hypothetical protein
MKKLYIILILASAFGCKKQIEEQQQNIIIQAMTTGEWKVTSYIKGGTDVTSDFSAYKFRFKTDFTVDAVNNTTVEKTGKWNADATARTITSEFTNATNPLLLLNGIWNISNNSWTWVEAYQTNGTETRTLRLDK